MPKKGKGKGKKKDIDWSADQHFDKNRSMVYIEHSMECPIFQMKAEEFGLFLQEALPERIVQLIRNRNGKQVPRPGAFEIGFSQTARTSVHNIWSGIERGPPRRDKFPLDFDALLPEIRKVLKKFYADLSTLENDDDDNVGGGGGGGAQGRQEEFHDYDEEEE